VTASNINVTELLYPCSMYVC